MRPDTIGDSWRIVALALLRWCANRNTVLRLSAISQNTVRKLEHRRIDSLLTLAGGIAIPCQTIYDRIWRLQFDSLRGLIDELKRSGVVPLVLKAADVLPRWYNNRPIGRVHDFDLAVRRTEVQRAKRALWAQGFAQQLFDPKTGTFVEPNLRDVAWNEFRQNELFHFSKFIAFPLDSAEEHVLAWGHPVYRGANGETWLQITADVHFASLETDLVENFDEERVWERAQAAAMNLGLRLSDADALWYILGKFYREVATHGRVSLRDFCYAIPLLTSGNVDWDLFLATCEQHDLFAGPYYYLRFIGALIGCEAPKEVITRLSPRGRAIGSSVQDYGWQLDRLFELDDELPFAIPPLAQLDDIALDVSSPIS